LSFFVIFLLKFGTKLAQVQVSPKLITMKKLLYLFAVLLTMSACKKQVLQRTTVKVVADDAVVNIHFTNDAEKYLSGQSASRIKELYIQAFKDELGRGKIDLDEVNPDYIIEIKQININEWVESVYEEQRWIDLSKIDIEGEFVLTESLVDVPNTFTIDDSVSEEIDEDKKGKDHSKGSKWGTSDKVEINGFGGLDGALEEHAEEARKSIKKKIKKNQ